MRTTRSSRREKAAGSVFGMPAPFGSTRPFAPVSAKREQPSPPVSGFQPRGVSIEPPSIQRRVLFGEIQDYDKKEFKRVVVEVLEALDTDSKAFVMRILNGDLAANTDLTFATREEGSSVTRSSDTESDGSTPNQKITLTIYISKEHLGSEEELKATLVHELTVHAVRFEPLINAIRAGEAVDFEKYKEIMQAPTHHPEFATLKNERYLKTAIRTIAGHGKKIDLAFSIINDMWAHYYRDTLRVIKEEEVDYFSEQFFDQYLQQAKAALKKAGTPASPNDMVVEEEKKLSFNVGRGYFWHANYGLGNFVHGYIEDGVVEWTSQYRSGFRAAKVISGELPQQYQSFTMERPALPVIGHLVWFKTA